MIFRGFFCFFDYIIYIVGFEAKWVILKKLI